MELKPIRNKKEHQAALKEVETPWSAKGGTPAADRLEVLSLQVERYEQEHFPIPDPLLSTARLTFCAT